MDQNDHYHVTLKWESDIWEVNGSKINKFDTNSIDTRGVIFLWWEIEPIWEYHNGGDYILNL
jgi:hypothetical protein